MLFVPGVGGPVCLTPVPRAGVQRMGLTCRPPLSPNCAVTLLGSSRRAMGSAKGLLGSPDSSRRKGIKLPPIRGIRRGMRLVSFQALHTTVSYCLLGLTGSSALDTVPSGREEWSPAGPSAPCPGNTLLPRAPGGISLLPEYW